MGSAALAWSPAAGAAKIACVGDSITYGYGLSDASTQSYPAVLQTLLGASHTVRNFGVSGTTLLKNGDMPYWDQANYTASGSFAPDIVIVMLGTNDAKPQNWAHQSEFSADYRDLVAHYRGLGAFVYVAAPPPVYEPGAYDIPPDVLDNQVVPLVRQIASEVNAPLVDVYQALSGKAQDFPDTVHPNADGAHLIAETVAAALATNGFGGNGNGGVGGTGTAGAAQGGRVNGGADNGAGTSPGGGGRTSGTAGTSSGTTAGTTSMGGMAGTSMPAGGVSGAALGGAGGASALPTAGRDAGASPGGANSAGNPALGGAPTGGAPPAGAGTPSAAGTAAVFSDDVRTFTKTSGCSCRAVDSRDEGMASALLACIALFAMACTRARRH